MDGGHLGFNGHGVLPWRAPGRPGGEDYGPPYNEMVENLRQFLDRVAAARPDPKLLDELSGALRQWEARLEPFVVDERDRVFGRRTDLVGRAQSMVPPVEATDSGDDWVTATVRFGPYFLGGNGAAHGGAIPLVFDELLGRLANSGGRPPQRTAYLRTDYRSITPIGPTLQLHAHMVSEEGRKRVFRGSLHDEDTLCAEVEGLFIALKPGQP